jgi:uncharacterized protein with HEPN domain
MKTDEVYLRHVLDAIAQIEAYMEGVSRMTFEAERMRQDAVVRQLEIIGEACRQLSPAFRAKHDAVPWRAIIGMRNRIAHDYLNIDLDVVWDAVEHDLPTLKRQVQAMLDA